MDICNQHCVKAIDLCKQIISNNQDIENIALLYFNDKNYRQAHKYYKKALKYFKFDKIDNHCDIQRLQNIIDTVNKYINKAIIIQLFIFLYILNVFINKIFIKLTTHIVQS